MSVLSYLSGLRAYRPKRGWRRPLLWSLGIGIVLIIGVLLLYAHFFGPVDPYAQTQEFIVQPDQSVYEITKELRNQGFIKSSTAFAIAFARYDIRGRGVTEGGYEISAAMDTLSIAKALASPPYLAWITFPSGWRKEQIADLLQRKLGWSDAEWQHWVEVDTVPSPEVTEGVYYGDTYLIPTDQPPALIAARFRSRFEDVFAPYAKEAAQQGIPWTDVLTMASLIEREAAKNDKALVAGILWNRIHTHMGLQVDATLQYMEGKEGNWWPTPDPADKKIDSPFNTYKYAGLPPHPIANPSLESIDAVLNPTKTNCLYYLHDPDGTIHCSATYAGQVSNVNRYLK